MRCTPTIARSSVDLPLPLGPSRPVTRPGSTHAERPGRTTVPPRRTRSRSTRTAVTPPSLSLVVVLFS
jgi:hypothetical protein